MTDRTAPPVPAAAGSPETEAPAQELPACETPETEVPKSEVRGTKVLKTELPETDVPATDVPETELPEVGLAAAVLDQARRTPSAVAVEDGDRLLDYAELDLLSARVAARLRERGVGAGQSVAVCLPRSWQLVCVMLGIRRAGATVVPLDRLSPPDRQRHILDDSGAVAVVHDGTAEHAHGIDAGLLLGPTAAPLDVRAAALTGDGDGTGFLFYTSGSTGRPKGVEVTDAGVLRLARPGWLDPRPGARFACLSNPAFDALSFEVWVPLLTGGVCVVLDDSEVHSPHRLAAALRERRVDTVFITVALFNTVVEKVPGCFADAGQVLVGGERLDARAIRSWYDANPDAGTVLHNVYGPTEATTFALCHPIPRDVDGDSSIPVGTALPGTGLLLRTPDGRVAEDGEVAELLLSGPALARGYRNLPELTERCFVHLADGDGTPRRWYRTGDLVRRDAEGRVHFVGRADRQVKVRGFRVEPGEVEQRILALPAVRHAHVCTRRDSADRHELLAFLVLGDDGLSFADYERHLTTALPPYMRPHRTHLVPELPLTANGKVDQAALVREAAAPWRGTRADAVAVSAAQRPVLEIAEDILGMGGLRPDDRWIPSGGDSLKALRLRFEIQERYGVDIPQDLVLRADFAALADAVRTAPADDRPPVPTASDSADGADGTDSGDGADAPATSEQERLWLLHRRDPDDRSYEVPLAFRVQGTVDPRALRRALRTLVERHPALRTRLVPAPDGLRQRTEAPYDPWTPLAAREGEPWQETAGRFFAHRFDLTEPHMLRAAWADHADGGLLLLHLHHVAVDGWSLNLLFRDLTAAYADGPGPQAPGSAQAPAPAPSPVDLARWQRDWRATAGYERLRTRLRDHYAHAPEPSPALPAPPPGSGSRAGLLRTSLDPARRAALDRRAAELGLTRFQLLVSAFAASVYGVTGQARPLVAAPVANRPRPEFAESVGMFANTVLLDLALSPDDSLRTHLGAHADTVRRVLEGQEVLLADVLTEPAFRERSPLFDYLFVLENTEFSALRPAGCAVEPLWPEPAGAKCALTLSVVEEESGLGCLWEYRDDFGAVRAQTAALLFRRALERLTGGDDTTLRELLAPHRSSGTAHGRPVAPDFTTVAEGFARQVARTPDAPAVTLGRTTLTYAELDAQANELASLLSVPEDPAAPASVALYLQPSVEHVVALLAAARRNLTVVPLDPAYPAALLRHVLAQAAPLCVLTGAQDLDVLATITPPDLPRHVVTLTRTPTAPPVPYRHQGLRPLYTLFTSGSTGTPKGVKVPDRTLCSLLTWQRSTGGLERPAVTQQFSMLSFDVSFQEILTTLCSGGELRLVRPAWRQDMPTLLDELETGGAERIFLPYVALQLLAEHGVRAGVFPSRLRDVVTAGEQLVCTDAIRRWFAGLPEGARLFNHYGPTETHVVSALCLDGDPAAWPARPAVGRPVAGAVLRVVDDGGLPVPTGVTGDLLIGGPMVTRCYLGDPAAHRDRFVDDPELGTLYRSGDRARFDEDGLLHYAGRDDGQVKLGGHRLELGQVEAALLDCPGVVNAVAGVLDARLVAVLQCRGADPDPADLTRRLARLLPAYVRVAAFRRVTELPRTPSGKLDRRAALTAAGRELRPGEDTSMGTDADAGLSPLELRLTELFRAATGRTVGVDERFLDAGATSLDLMRFQLRCAGEGDLPFSVPDLFEHVTLRALARLVSDDGAGRGTPARRPETSGGARRTADEPVAVVGMAVRLPGAPDLAAFWDLVVSGRRGIEHFAADDGRVGARSQLAGPLGFDPGRFRISPHEARLMDPQQRQLLMNCAEALAHAGIGDPARLRVGLVASCGENTYFQRMLRDGDPALLPDSFRLALHHEKDFLATKAAYHLGLTGPAFTLQSACSSSLAGVHVAAGMLRQGDADVMLVGGVLVDTGLTDGYTYRPQHIFSPDGHCRPFSADAEGTVGASGTGVVVLKPLAAARRDGDPVYAVVTGSGLNNDGSGKLGYSAPSLPGQRAAIRAALARSGRAGGDVGYVEAHGTGTRLGDPVEAAALRQAYGLAADARTALSSVKSQIGHLGAAAGVVGLVRAVLAVHHGVVPPTADFDRLNPEIADGPFRIPVAAEPWPAGRRRVAGVSSFGIGGTNAHVLLEQPDPEPDPDPGPAPAEPLPCLVLSGASQAAVRADGRRIADYLAARPDAYPQVLRHLQAGRPALAHRAAAVCPDAASAVAWLRSLPTVTAPPPRDARPVEELDPHAVAEAWTAGRTVAWPAGPAAAPWDFPPPAFDTAEYDYPRAAAPRPAENGSPRALGTPSPAESDASNAPAHHSPGTTDNDSPHILATPSPAESDASNAPAHDSPRTTENDLPHALRTPRPAESGSPRVSTHTSPSPADDRSGTSRLPAAQWLHQSLWTRARRARTGAPASGRTAVVVIGPGRDGESWRFLERHYGRVVTVRAGQGLTRLGDDRYEADVTDAVQLAALLDRLTGADEPAVDWLHALPLALDGSPTASALETAEWACLDTVAALALALAGRPEPRRPRVWLLSQRAQPVTGSVHTPAAALLAAALEVPRQELGVTLRWTDLPGPHPADWAAHLPDLLLDGTVTDPATALRDGFWWRRTSVPVPVGEAPRRAAAPGTHLVLGGTGGIGITLAASLLGHPGNRVVLVGRSAEVPAGLRAFGDRVTLVTADLAAEDPAAVADRLSPLLDGLAGIVHAAGAAAGGLLARREPAAARQVTAAKLRGALLVELLVAEHAPDHVLYCSSMAARFGGVGQFDYAAANACLDAYAHHSAPGGDATVRTSVGWDAWRDVGMAQRHADRADARHRDHLAVALTPQEGTAVFERALHLQLPYLMVSTTDLTAARAFYEPAAATGGAVAPLLAPARAPAHAEPEQGPPPVPGDPGGEVTGILLALLGLDTVDPQAALYDLGADSLTLLELLDEIKRRHGTDIELSRLSHRVSLAEILGHLGGAARPSGSVEVEVWQRGPGPDVLCLVHPVGGDVQAYRPLVSALPDDLTVCLIADPALHDPGLPDRSIEERAAHYLAALRREFPAAGHRLTLAGWSFGAWTALSMAALAEAEGRPVTALRLLDPPPPGAGQRLAGYDEERIQAVFARELSGNGAGRPADRGHGATGPGADPGDGLSESGRGYAERLARCCRANLAAMAGHRLPRLRRTPTTVWLAARAVAEATLAPEPTAPGAWDAHLPASYRLHQVAADHYQIVAEPQVREIAAALTEPVSPTDARPQPAGRS
ncbi:amino acid adenylation domain-containing protein [Streptomyces sp. NPDC051987]|uniref:amino acid adenylation domain-containing protein n=1 Tax=Streptomyces sp. NPDC051987 TaxID=3155808 RepID=UPI00343EE1D2